MIRVIRIIHQNLQRRRQQAKQTHNLLVTILVFVCESYLFCASCIYTYVELRRIEINNIIRVVKYEYDEYFKRWI